MSHGHGLGQYTGSFILLQTKVGKKKDPGFRSSKDQIEVLAGTLLNLVEEVEGRSDYIFETLLDSEKPISVICGIDEFRQLTLEEEQLLRPIPTCRERLEVYMNKDWLNDGMRLKEGDPVYVKLKTEQSELPGVLRFKGHQVPDSKGVMFGIELKEPKGTCDGTFRRKKFFSTEEDHGVFVPLHKVRKSRDGWQKSTRLRADEDCEGLYQQQGNIKCNLVQGERVVWMSDDGPEKGSVQWIGYLPDDHSGNITVGVSFDNPVGTGTGKYKDKRLFYSKQGHASLIPLIGLIKEEEFENPGMPSSSPDVLNTNPDFIKEQEKLLQDIANSASHMQASAAQHNRSQKAQTQTLQQQPYQPSGRSFNVQEAGCPEVAGAMAEGVVGYPRDQLYKLGGLDTSGLNPLYERTRCIEESPAPPSSGSKSNNSANFGRAEDPDLCVGSLVEVQLKEPLYGVIRWIGTDAQSGKVTAGLEMEEESPAGTDGTFKGQRFFTCPSKKAFFVPLYKCSKDKRFQTQNRKISSEFGGQTTPDIAGDIPPPDIPSLELKMVCGKNKGIQGHHNSCYLDATLFCMFYFTTVFDFIFNRPAGQEDLPDYPQVQQVLKEGIVNPLRKFNYVRADKVLKLRALLDKLGTVPGMMSEEKDPEEFLSALLTQIMKADPLLHLSSGEHTYFYQLFIEKDEHLLLPTTQKLVELSFLQGNVKLKEVPSCLMIQMPRFGKEYKMFHRIVPSLQLDITDILENCPRDCIVCGGLARFECKDCYQVHGPGLNTTAFCEKCVKRSHQHASRRNHNPMPLETIDDFLPFYETMKQEALQNARQQGKDVDPMDISIQLPREKMELFAVICIQTSHYVSFVKCGLGKDAPWVFFDSMADRMGEQGGYNIPEVVPVPDLSKWLAEGNFSQLQKSDDKDLPEHLRRILCDGYMCMYQSPDVMMYN